jgi:hypothetical protein
MPTSNATLKNLENGNKGRVYADSVDLISKVGCLYHSKETFDAGYPSIGIYRKEAEGYFAAVSGYRMGLEIGAEVQS